MLGCLYEPSCRNERTMDFEFCIPHLDTPRGRQHVMNVISTGALTLPSQVEAAIERARQIPDADYQTQALEKMSEALQRVLDWEDKAKQELDAVPEKDRRFTDRKGAEQVHSNVLIYERALDRTTRVLKDVSKMAINEKMVSLGKAQTELVIRLLMTVISKLELENDVTDRARQILLELFTSEANLAPRVQYEVTKELSPPTVVTADSIPAYADPVMHANRG
jgi:hypothetical protein